MSQSRRIYNNDSVDYEKYIYKAFLHVKSTSCTESSQSKHLSFTSVLSGFTNTSASHQSLVGAEN